MDELTLYYTYLYLDPRKLGKYAYEGLDQCFLYEPFYVGKGKGIRINVHLRKGSLKYKCLKNNKIKAIINAGHIPYSLKYRINLTQYDALALECSIIEKIGRYDLKTGVLCNMTPGGDGVTETMSLKQRKPVYKICKNTNIILDKYDSATIAANATKLNVSNILCCCHGKLKTSGGFIWSYVENNAKTIKPKAVIKCTKNYEIICTYDDAKIASKKESTNYYSIRNCCDGKTGIDGDFIWEYVNISEELRMAYRQKREGINSNTEKKIKRICKATNEESVYVSLNEAAADSGITPSMVNMIAKGKRGRLCKYKFYYVDDRSYDEAIEKENTAQYLNRKPIMQLSKDGALIQEWESATLASTTLGISHSRICTVARSTASGTLAGGFKWEYCVSLPKVPRK